MEVIPRLSEPGWAQSTKRKISLLQFAEELGNVSRACKIMGYHRDPFYRGQAQGCRQGLRAGRRRRALLARLRKGVHREDAGDGGRPLYGRVLTFYEALPTAA
jgi:hypothetical protein